MSPAVSGPPFPARTTPVLEWDLPDSDRAAWYVKCVDGPPYRYTGGPVQSEVIYRDYRIVQQPYTGAQDKSEAMGFDIPYCYAVLDEFDDPMTTRRFWSPWDARHAIDFFLWHRDTFSPKHRQVFTTEHEYELLMCYRRQMPLVFEAVYDMLSKCVDAQEFGDNPAQSIIDRVHLLNSAVRGWSTP